MQKYNTLTSALLHIDSTEVGIVFIDDDNQEEFMSYPELVELSMNYLSYMQSQGIKKGDEVILAFHSLKNFVIGYWGALFGGIIPVPLAIPKNNEELQKVINVWRVLVNPWIIVDDPLVVSKFEKRSTYEKEIEIVNSIIKKIIVSEDCSSYIREQQVVIEEAKEDDIVFIQFSSGSTGNPKGVVLTHKNLVSNVYDIIEASNIVKEDTFMSWKPITHDFGMIAFHLVPILARITQYRMTTKHFIWNATDWFSVVNKHRVTVLGTPNFGIQHFINRFFEERAELENWDLSCVRIIYNAAEMIHPELCKKFIHMLKPYGIREDIFKPGYGLAENTLVVSVCRESEHMRSIIVHRDNLNIGDQIKIVDKGTGLGVEYALCGQSCNHSEVKIIDDNGNELEEGYVGHIHVKGDCVTQGYYRNLEATQEIIKKDFWLDTQDVGFLYDGQIVIIGRQKEVIIIGGINYYPRDIEEVILQEYGYNKLNQFIACGIQNRKTGTDDLVIFVYFKGVKEEFKKIETNIIQIVRKKMGLEVNAVIPIRHVPKTTSGKVQRYKIIKDNYSSISENMTQTIALDSMKNINIEDYQKKVLDILNEFVEMEEEDYTKSLFDLGCSSMQLLQLQSRLVQKLGIQLESTFIIDHPIIEDLVKQICNIANHKNDEKPIENKSGIEQEDVAVVGMAFRFPGGVDSEDELWNVLSQEIDVISRLPEERWENSDLEMDEITTFQAGFIKDVDKFDPLFFGITPKEAELLDPQHRLLLELTWKAFENAGINVASMEGSSEVGVYIGIASNDYLQAGRELGHVPENYTYTGNMFNSASGRLSYVYGFRGPCEAIDTACSSSLYAIHHAVNDIKCGNCSTAVVGAVNMILTPDGHISFSKLSALSPTGRCHSFDDSADGYIRSEGGAVLILKKLSEAKIDKNPILGVIKGSAVNHNGHSGGLTVPSGIAQQEVITKALRQARLGIDDISYVEAHGSGTPIGDPQEVNALANVYKEKKDTLYIGSVKSNFGHMEAVAGMGAICKVLVSLKHELLPATMNFKKGNHLIDWDHIPIEVVSELKEWTCNSDKLRAGISSFGISGSNAHIIVEQYKENTEACREEITEHPPYLLNLSAKSRKGLWEYANNVAEWLSNAKEDYADIAYTINTRRAELRYRESFLIEQAEDMKTKLSLLSENTIGYDCLKPKTQITFVFTGQGSQYPKMAYELYNESKIFQSKLEELDAIFKKIADFSIIEIMFQCTTEEFKRPLYAQTMIFAVEVAIAYLWESLGIVPDMVLGHSIGEIAASCYAGVTSLEDSAKLVLERARIMEECQQHGYMATLLCNESKANDFIKDYDDVSIAAVNASENITISGAEDSMKQICSKARKNRVFVERLEVSHPFHSILMKESAKQFYKRIQAISFNKPRIKIVSTQTGDILGEERGIDAEYWRDNLVKPVLFSKSIATAVSLGCENFVEVGPMAVLSSLISQDYKEKVMAIPTLRKGFSSIRSFRECAGALWKIGKSINWNEFYKVERNMIRNIPNMCFDKQTIWYKNLRRDLTVSKEHTMLKCHEISKGNIEMKNDTREIKDYIKLCLNQITGIGKESMNDEMQLFSMGLDSLMLVQLGKRIDEKYDVDIPIKVFFNSLHTINLLADFIMEHTTVTTTENDIVRSTVIEPESVRKVEESVQENFVDSVEEATILQNSMRQSNTVCENSGLEQVIHYQLQVMEKQLALFENQNQRTSEKIPKIEKDEKKQSEKKQLAKKVGTYSNNIELVEDELTSMQRQFIADFEKKYVKATKKSKEYAENNRETLADWIASLNFNPSMKQMVYPIVSEKSKGSKFWDIDGNEYIDTAIGYGVSFFGHKPDFITDALKNQIELGFELGPQCKLAGEVAELIHEIIGVERVAFCNTGTEAVMVALRLARAVSGRDKIAKFITSFHGSFDGVLAEADGDASRPMSIGIPQKMIDDTFVFTYGSKESLEKIRKHGKELAAVLVEPVQTRNPSLQPKEFLVELRKICDEQGIALIFDEMVTGFRIELGGAQAYFGVKADMVLYGKLIAGGMPIGIVAGKGKYLDAVDGGVWSAEDDSKPSVPTTFFAGTFCKHPLTMAVCKAVLSFLKENGEKEIQRVNAFTKEFADEVNAYFVEAKVPLKMVTFGSLYKYETLVSTDMTKFSLEMNLFFKLMAYEGIYIWERRTCFFSLAHTEEDKQKIIRSIRKCVELLRAGGFEFKVADFYQLESNKEKKNDFRINVQNRELSDEEKRIYILSNLKGGNETYQVTGKLRFDGIPDIDKMKCAFDEIAKKHSKLRTSFELQDKVIHQKVEDSIQQEFYLFDMEDGIQEDQIREIINKPFDLSKAPLWRYGIIKEKDDVYQLIISFHHIIADGTSIEIILRELSEYLSQGFLSPLKSKLYDEYVKMQNDFQFTKQFTQQRNWWLEQYRTLPEPLNIETDAARDIVSTFRGEHYYFEIENTLYQEISELIASLHTTPFIFYMTALSVLLHKVGGQHDFCIGIPVDQRVKGDFEDTIGMFAQSLPIRIKISKEDNFISILEQVREFCLDAIDYSMYSYDELIQDLRLKKDYSRNALFDVMFTYTNAKKRVYQFGEVNGVTQDFGIKHAPFDLSLELTERNGCLYGDLNYAVPLYGDKRVERLMQQFTCLLENILHHPNAQISEYSIFNEEVLNRLLKMGQGSEGKDEKSMREIFKEAYNSNKEQVAIQYAGEKITYEVLEEKVNQHAAFLVEKGLKPGDLIGILLPVVPEYIVCMLAIQKIGCAWLPMDVHYPIARLQYIIENSGLKAIICTEEMKAIVDADIPKILLNKVNERTYDEFVEVEEEAEQLAYVIYTSGSSGNPKGVMLSNGAVANFLIGMKEALKWKEKKRVACMTTPSFDIFNLETLLTLAHGGCVVLAEREETIEPSKIASFILDNAIDYLQITPTRLRLLETNKAALESVLNHIDKIIIGGEQFPEDLLSTLQEHSNLEIYNVYGPTETCIWSTVKDLTKESVVNIGLPIRNTQIYILDENMELVMEETAGELWIGGAGVANGYLNNEKLTEERFLENPFGTGKIYKTGDQAVWKSGELYCLGRTDNQVKIRGYRVELEEIEQVMVTHEQVVSAAVSTKDNGSNNTIIVGVYQLKEEGSINSSELREWVMKQLPDYMVPAVMKEVTQIPQTQNGKIDRNEVIKYCTVEQEVIQNETDSYHKLIQIWKQILGNVEIGYDDTFFDLGGNSYSIILLHAELEKSFPNVFDVTDLFANPTIHKQLTFIDEKSAGEANSSYLIRDGISIDATLVTNGSGKVGRMEVDLSDDKKEFIIRMKKMHYTPDEWLISLYAVYINKVYHLSQFKLYVSINENECIPVEFDFEVNSYFEQVLEKYREGVNNREARIKIDEITKVELEETEVNILCCNRYSLKNVNVLKVFDFALLVVERSNGVTVSIEYGKRINEEEMSSHIGKYMNFVEMMIGYMETDK